jgi:hypothetical protein
VKRVCLLSIRGLSGECPWKLPLPFFTAVFFFVPPPPPPFFLISHSLSFLHCFGFVTAVDSSTASSVSSLAPATAAQSSSTTATAVSNDVAILKLQLAGAQERERLALAALKSVKEMSEQLAESLAREARLANEINQLQDRIAELQAARGDVKVTQSHDEDDIDEMRAERDLMRNLLEMARSDAVSLEQENTKLKQASQSQAQAQPTPGLLQAAPAKFFQPAPQPQPAVSAAPVLTKEDDARMFDKIMSGEASSDGEDIDDNNDAPASPVQPTQDDGVEEEEDYDAARRRQMEQVKAARAAALAVAAQYDATTAVRMLT